MHAAMSSPPRRYLLRFTHAASGMFAERTVLGGDDPLRVIEREAEELLLPRGLYLVEWRCPQDATQGRVELELWMRAESRHVVEQEIEA